MATPQDAELILKLYDLRREPVMREARKWVSNWNPASCDEIIALQRAMHTTENNYWRQVLGYWDMAAAFVLHRVLDADLFLDTNAENLFLYAKFAPFHEEYAKVVGQPFMRNTAKMVETYPRFQERYQGLVVMMEARRQREAAAKANTTAS